MKIWGCWVTEKKTRDYDWALKIYELIVLGELILPLSTILRLVFGTVPTVWYLLFYILLIHCIYPAMTAFTDQYSLPNIFFDIGQL